MNLITQINEDGTPGDLVWVDGMWLLKRSDLKRVLPLMWEQIKVTPEGPTIKGDPSDPLGAWAMASIGLGAPCQIRGPASATLDDLLADPEGVEGVDWIR
jgi:hypothetical protein